MHITAIGEILFDVFPDSKKPGGAPFNFIYHIIRLTGNGIFISRVGNDTDGKEILAYLKSKKINTDHIQVDERHPTGIVNVSLQKHGVPVFEILPERAYDYIEKNNSINDLISRETELLYFGTLAQRQKVSKETIQSLWGKSIKYFCDINLRQNFYSCDTIELSLYNSSIVKINSGELNIISKLLSIEFRDRKEIAGFLINKYDLDILCITLGSEGAEIFNKYEQSKHTEKTTGVIDTVGAGDAYSAILCIGYLKDWDINTINKLASKFASDICKIRGALPAEENFYTKYLDIIRNE